MNPDERQLLHAIARRCLPGQLNGVTPRKVADELGMNSKRACYLFEKWTGKGWYDYGVSVDMGWLSEKGRKEATLDERE